MKAYFGTITRHLPSTRPNINDQLYHVEWDDGDKADLDASEQAQGLELYAYLQRKYKEDKSVSAALKNRGEMRSTKMNRIVVDNVAIRIDGGTAGFDTKHVPRKPVACTHRWTTQHKMIGQVTPVGTRMPKS